MLLHAAHTPFARAAPDVDLADDALPYPPRVIFWRVLDDAHELVAGDPCEAGVSFEQLQIGAADAGARHANATLVASCRIRDLSARENPTRVEHKRTHWCGLLFGLVGLVGLVGRVGLVGLACPP